MVPRASANRPPMEKYAEPRNGASLLGYNSGGTEEICGWDKKLSCEIPKWTGD